MKILDSNKLSLPIIFNIIGSDNLLVESPCLVVYCVRDCVRHRKCALIRVDAKLPKIMVWRVLLQARIVLSRAQQQQWHMVYIRYGKQLKIKHYGKDTPDNTYCMQRYVQCHESIQEAVYYI